MPVPTWRTRLLSYSYRSIVLACPDSPDRRTEAVLDGCTRGCSAAHLMANAVLFSELEGTVCQPRQSGHETRSISPVSPQQLAYLSCEDIL